MAETVPATNIGEREIGYVLLALLSDEAKDQIVSLQQELDRELPGALWLMPRDALHVTLCEIIQPKDYGEDKTQLFERNRQAFEDVSSRVLAGFGEIAVQFDTIEASSGAIIIRGQDDGSFNAIRKRLVAQLSLPEATKRPPDIVHSSIARYTKSVELGNVEQIVDAHRIDLQEQVTAFKLVRCSVQPLLEYETLQTYRLK